MKSILKKILGTSEVVAESTPVLTPANDSQIEKFFDGKCKRNAKDIVDGYARASQKNQYQAFVQLLEYAQEIPLQEELWENIDAKACFDSALNSLNGMRDCSMRRLNDILSRVVPSSKVSDFLTDHQADIKLALTLGNGEEKRQFLTVIFGHMEKAVKKSTLPDYLEKIRKDTVASFISNIFKAAAELHENLQQVLSQNITKIRSIEQDGDPVHYVFDPASQAMLVSVEKPDDKLIILCRSSPYTEFSPMHHLTPIFMGKKVAQLAEALQMDITRLKPPIAGLTPQKLEALGAALGYDR